MTAYGLQFLVAAILILVVLLHHFIQRRHTEGTNSRIFRFFICAGMLDIVFDIISTVLISGDYPQLSTLALIVLSFFYLMQVTMPCAMVLYVVSLRETERTNLHKNYISGLIPAGIMALIVVINMFSGWLFYFDENGNYWRGDWYLLTYIYAVIYGIIAFVSSAIHRRELSQRSFIVVIEYMVIEIACTAVQALTGYLTTGFGIALGIMIMYLTINNPERYTDHLTGAFNRLYFRKWVREHVRHHQVGAVVIKLYQLDKIQRTFSTGTCEQLLRETAKKLREMAYMDRVFRTRDNLFVLPTVDKAEFDRLVERAKECFSEPVSVGGEKISSPVIICAIPEIGDLVERDIMAAFIDYMLGTVEPQDDTMVVISSASTMEGFLYERSVERYLQSALDENLLDVWFQPIYSVNEGRIVAMEALSRLNHPTLGSVSPDLFITLAERNGMIANIGLQQLDKICRFIKENPVIMEKLENVKINLSPAEILAPDHSDKMIETIRSYGLPLNFFQLEITETVATEYSRQLYRIIDKFRELGIDLCLDDFGSGYANLNTVMKLPFYAIKLDRSMLDGILYDPQIASFYQRIVAVLHTLGYAVIAEGVEEKAEMELLQEWGVDMIQGYYISRPLHKQNMLKMLNQ